MADVCLIHLCMFDSSVMADISGMAAEEDGKAIKLAFKGCVLIDCRKAGCNDIAGKGAWAHTVARVTDRMTDMLGEDAIRSGAAGSVSTADMQAPAAIWRRDGQGYDIAGFHDCKTLHADWDSVWQSRWP